MLLAKDVAPIETDFIDVLEHTPGTKAEKQAYFQSKSIRVPRTNYEAMWGVLTERLHHSGAAQSVFECLQAHMPIACENFCVLLPRPKLLTYGRASLRSCGDLFFQNGNLRRVGELFLKHRPTHPGRPLRPVATARRFQTAKPYEIAISFAGENRQFVGDVARELDSKGVRVSMMSSSA